MKRLLYVITLIISACGQLSNENKEQKNADNMEQSKNVEMSSKKEILTFHEVKGRAVLIGGE